MGKWSNDNRVPMVHVGRGIFVGQVCDLMVSTPSWCPCANFIIIPLH